MKKSFLIIIAALALTVPAVAQDTIHTVDYFENYYTPYWHKHNLGDTLYCVETSYGASQYHGQVMFTFDTLTVYGIVVGTTTIWPHPIYDGYNYNPETDEFDSIVPAGYYDHNGNWHLIGDSSLVESYMDFILMQVETNQQPNTVVPASDTLRLHLMYDSVSYYLDMEFVDLFYAPWSPESACPILSVYEKYFDHPAKVYDKFYLGGFNHSAQKYFLYGGYDQGYMYPRINILGWGLSSDIVRVGSVVHWTGINDHWEEYDGNHWQWFFPILTPNPDTTVYVPNDSTQTGDSTQTSIQRAAWEKYVSLQPNPATDVATVLSSFGMAAVEVFDMAGNRVLVHKAKGYEAKLDVSALPRGSYIVRINTPMGTTSRKLLLQ